MLFNVDNVMKLGGKKLPGQVRSIEVEQEASIDNIKDKKKKTKKNQPTGYKGAAIRIEIMLERTETFTAEEMVNQLQNMFRPYKQKKAKLLKIINTDCNSRGITRVYFKKLVTMNEISNSYRTATLELLAPVFAGVKVKKSTTSNTSGKTKNEKSKTKKSSGRSPAKDTKDTKKDKDKAKKLTS